MLRDCFIGRQLTNTEQINNTNRQTITKKLAERSKIK